MEVPEDLLYTKEHEWIKIEEDGTAIIGITDYAQDSLGDIVYVEIPEEGSDVLKGEPFGVVESVKAVSDLYCPLSGTVTESNEAIVDSPELINEEPFEDAWMIKIELSDKTETETLLSPQVYRQLLEEEN